MEERKYNQPEIYDPVSQLMRKSVLFKNASEKTLELIKSRLKKVKLESSEPVFLENELSEKVYFVVSGSVEVVVYDQKKKQSSRVKTFNIGDNFSEFSVLTGSNHSTSCFALEPTILWTLDKASLWSILHRDPTIPKEMVYRLAGFNRQITNSHNYIEYFKPRMFEYHGRFKNLVNLNLIRRFQAIPIRLSGQCLVVALVDQIHSQAIKQQIELQDSSIHLKLLLISKSDYEYYLKKFELWYRKGGPKVALEETPDDQEEEKEEAIETLLPKINYFSSMGIDTLKAVISHLKRHDVEPGSVIFEPGSQSSHFYLIAKGQVDFFKILEDQTANHVVSLFKGDIFSEISLILNTTHSLQAKATRPSVIYTLAKEIFDKLLTSPSFSICMAQNLARRLQEMNKQVSTCYKKTEEIDFTLIKKEILPLGVMIHEKVIPVSLKGKDLVLGVFAHDDGDIIFNIINRYLSKYRVEIVHITEDLYAQALGKLPSRKQGRVSAKSQEITEVSKPPAQFLENILDRLAGLNSSDLHFEHNQKGMSIRYRVDGDLREHRKRLSREYANQLVNKIKVYAKMDIAEKRLPQNGQIALQAHGRPLYARVSTIPTKHGENVVLRLIQQKESLLPLNTIVPDREAIHYLINMTKHRQGLYLVTGPTGSGKTTTLYSMLNHVNNVSKKIITVEDPVEMNFSGITQIEVKSKLGLTFAEILRHVLRQDPDVIMIGEIRDRESAKIAFEAAMTGHLVLTTLHSNNSLDVIPRLRGLGIDPQTIGSALVGVSAQRLLPKLCPDCRVVSEATNYEKEIFRKMGDTITPDLTLHRANGCSKCHNTGYSGRIPILEYWKNTAETKSVIFEDGSYSSLYDSIQGQNFRSLYQFALKMVRNGITTLEKVQEFLYGL